MNSPGGSPLPRRVPWGIYVCDGDTENGITACHRVPYFVRRCLPWNHVWTLRDRGDSRECYRCGLVKRDR